MDLSLIISGFALIVSIATFVYTKSINKRINGPKLAVYIDIEGDNKVARGNLIIENFGNDIARDITIEAQKDDIISCMYKRNDINAQMYDSNIRLLTNKRSINRLGPGQSISNPFGELSNKNSGIWKIGGSGFSIPCVLSYTSDLDNKRNIQKFSLHIPHKEDFGQDQWILESEENKSIRREKEIKQMLNNWINS